MSYPTLGTIPASNASRLKPFRCLIQILLSTPQTQFPLPVVSEDGRAILYPPSNSHSSYIGKFALSASLALSVSRTTPEFITSFTGPT